MLDVTLTVTAYNYDDNPNYKRVARRAMQTGNFKTTLLSGLQMNGFNSACDAYVRVHPGTKKPVGTMANGKLRAMRSTAHRYFDMIHKSGLMTKNEAYQWLAYKVCAPLSQAHIGLMGEYYCQQVIDESKKLLISRGKLREDGEAVG